MGFRWMIVLGCVWGIASPAAELRESVGRAPASNASLTVGGSVYLANAVGYPGLSINFSGRVAGDLYLGLETGAGYRDRQALTPVLATVEYRLRARRLQPFLGAAVGTVALWGDSVSEWKSALLVKPGVDIAFENAFKNAVALRLEPRLGFFSRDFVFAPVVGATFAL